MAGGIAHTREGLKEVLARDSKLDEETGCLIWQRPFVNSTPQISVRLIQKNPIAAYRLAYMLHIGEIPKGKAVRHACENVRCVNPDHLFLGGRGAPKRSQCHRNHPASRAYRNKHDVLKCRDCDNERKRNRRLTNPWVD